MEVKKAYEIKDAKIKFVSLVDKAANRKRFLIAKAENGGAEFTTCGRIVKADEKHHFVTGIVYEPLAEDAHGNYMTEEEITKAAYYFAQNSGKVDLQHSFEPLSGAKIVESWIAKADFKLGEETVKKGTWLMTMELSDPEIWDAVKKGELTGFSMGGTGIFSTEDVPLAQIEKDAGSQSEKRGILKRLSALLGFDESDKPQQQEPQCEPVEKAGIPPQAVRPTEMGALHPSASGLADGTLGLSGEKCRASVAKSQTEPQQANRLQKTKEEEEMTKAEVEQLVQKAVGEAVKKALAEENAAAEIKNPNEPVTMEAVQEMVGKAVQNAVAPVLKARGVPTAINDEAIENPVEKHYLHGIL